jgi:hypothetical protein
MVELGSLSSGELSVSSSHILVVQFRFQWKVAARAGYEIRRIVFGSMAVLKHYRSNNQGTTDTMGKTLESLSACLTPMRSTSGYQLYTISSCCGACGNEGR